MTFIAPAVIVLALAIAACSPVDGASRPSADQKPAAPPANKAPTSPKAVAPKPVDTGTSAHGAATKAYLDRIREYVAFHNNVEKMVPSLRETPDPIEISKREQALGAALIKSRPDAKMGDFFVKEYQPYLIKIIQDDFRKRPAADRKALLVELPKDVNIGVNTVYPTSLPLATFPANLLKALPELPPELEYRILGRHLILRDVKGNVIVDMVPDVFPIPGRT